MFMTGVWIRDPDPAYKKIKDPDMVCSERLDPDPVNIRTDSKPWNTFHNVPLP